MKGGENIIGFVYDIFKPTSKVEEVYTRFLVHALKNIDRSYYQITTTYGEIIRERVFSYEFYHQMRLIKTITN